MALVILTNSAGNSASQIQFDASDVADGYDETQIIAGPRSTLMRAQAATGCSLGYVFSDTLTCDYMVVARADLLLTENGARVYPTQKSAGGTWSQQASPDYNELAAGDLVGPRSQDLVFPVSPSEIHGIGLAAEFDSSEAMIFSKLYGCVSFAFDEEPMALSSEEVEPGTFFTPLRGTWPYEVEKRIAIAFPAVSDATYLEFRALPQIYNWPIFLYDTTGDLWSWKLEHVVLETMTPTLANDGRWEIQASFLRLKHYD